VYRVLEQDPFPNGPKLSAGDLFSGGGPSSGSKVWNWGFTGTQATPVIHYLVVDGQPDESGADALSRSRAPSPTLPDGARINYFGKEYEPGHFVFETVASGGSALLEGADIESCTIAENQNHDQTKGYDVVTMRPWIKIQFTKEGLRKLSTVAKGTGLVVAFGDDALSLMWLPEWSDDGYFPANFPVEGLGDGGRTARAKALADACADARLRTPALP